MVRHAKSEPLESVLVMESFDSGADGHAPNAAVAYAEPCVSGPILSLSFLCLAVVASSSSSVSDSSSVLGVVVVLTQYNSKLYEVLSTHVLVLLF